MKCIYKLHIQTWKQALPLTMPASKFGCVAYTVHYTVTLMFTVHLTIAISIRSIVYRSALSVLIFNSVLILFCALSIQHICCVTI